MSSPPRTREFVHALWLTCAADGLDHACAEGHFSAGLSAATGTYLALCGHTVLIASMLTPPGPPCQACAGWLVEPPKPKRWWRRGR